MPGLRTPFLNPWMAEEDPMGFGREQRQGLVPRPSGRPVGWSSPEEMLFRAWMNKASAAAGTNANPDAYLHAYDYRGLFRDQSGMTLDPEDGKLHGSSKFKRGNHPNRFVYDQGRWQDSISGEQIDVEEIIKRMQVDLFGGW